MNLTMDKIISLWESEEHTVEDKINTFERFIFDHIGLKNEVEYYVEEGSFLARYLAGFIHRYFVLLKDVSFILLDPIHIFDIITSFAKSVVRHPIKTLKQVWSAWTKPYTRGMYGLGRMTADAFLACIIAGGATLLAEGEVAVAAEVATSELGEQAVTKVMGIPKKLVGVGENIEKTIESCDDFFDLIKEDPVNILKDAKESLSSGISYGKIRSYKVYSGNFLKRRHA